jgi:hypothetical protein
MLLIVEKQEKQESRERNMISSVEEVGSQGRGAQTKLLTEREVVDLRDGRVRTGQWLRSSPASTLATTEQRLLDWLRCLGLGQPFGAHSCTYHVARRAPRADLTSHIWGPWSLACPGYCG